MSNAGPFVVGEHVQKALASGTPVVALESTLLAHGLNVPYLAPIGFHFELGLRNRDIAPATVAVIDGRPTIGLDHDQLRRIEQERVHKASIRDLPVVMARKATAATTVAATAFLAAQAGVRVFATGGLGGVHRGARETYDESADLLALSRVPVTVVCAGVKSILDVGATLERLESYGVTVLGYGTDRFPGFYLADSGFGVDWRADSPAEVVDTMAAADELGRTGAVVVANPLPPSLGMDPDRHQQLLDDGLAAAETAGITGKEVTPFLLSLFHRATDGATAALNVDLVDNNIRVAGDIATAWVERASR